MDINCAKCGEPFEAYFINHELPPEERRRFMNGDGCPCCHWGEHCPSCSGTGKRRTIGSTCSTCSGSHYFIMRHHVEGEGAGSYTSGYQPAIRKYTAEQFKTMRVLKPCGRHEYKNATTEEYLVQCTCDGEPCERCNGTGALQQEQHTPSTNDFRALGDLFGSDVDGLQSMLSDMSD